MKRADKNWAHFYKIKYFKNLNFQKKFLIKVGLLVQYSSKKIFFLKDSTNFQHGKSDSAVTLFSEKMLISTKCISGFMPNSNKKY